ncbi:MAG: arginine--tRNA ligase [bacterium]
MYVKQYLSKLINQSLNIHESEMVINNLVPPAQPEWGDVAFKTFQLASKLNLKPVELALSLEQKLKQNQEFKAKATGPYLNITFSTGFICNLVLDHVFNRPSPPPPPEPQPTVVIDFSSPNIAKPFGVGHLRSTVIGAALYRIFKYLGYKVIGINHLGDWGTNFGMILTGYEQEGENTTQLEQDGIKYSYQLYVRTHHKAEQDQEINNRAREWFNKLEQGDPKAIEIWKRFREFSIKKFKQTYQRLGIEFDHYTGESFYQHKTDEAIDFLQKKDLTEIDQGMLIVRLDQYDLPPLLLKKSDGSTLYATREIAAVLYRLDTFNPDLLLYVVGNPQELHFKQISAALDEAGIKIKEKLIHVKFGHILGMSTRKGTLVFLDDLIDEAVRRAKEKMQENKTISYSEREMDFISSKVGIGALVFNDLKTKRIKDIEFNWDRALSFEGESGPYLQYAHARIKSIIRKSSQIPRYQPDAVLDQLNQPEEKALALAISDFPMIIEQAAREYEPSVISRYLLDLASTFSKFYHSCQVVGSKPELLEARLCLIEGCRITLAKGLELLGIEPLNKM